MARKTKVYAAEIDGLHEWIVAAPNQGEPLAAFGVNQNLFQQGLAHVEQDAKAIAAAEASPGVPLRRLKGSQGAFRPATEGDADAWAAAAKASGVKASRKPARPKPDRSALDAAEAALKSFEIEAEDELKALQREEEALERRRKQLAKAHEERLSELRRKVEQERRRFAL